jgi:hypothetical protein
MIMNKKETDLMYIRTVHSLFIFPKLVLSIENKFIKDFFTWHLGVAECFNFAPLNNCPLLSQHKALFGNGALIYKYIYRDVGLISRSIISQDEAGKLYYELSYLGKESYISQEIDFANIQKRPIIDGITVESYAFSLTEEERFLFLCRFFEWLFSQYASLTAPDKVKGIVFDCHLNNFIMNKDGFTLIDKDMVATQDLYKADCIDYVCCVHQFSETLFQSLIAHFGLKDNRQECRKMRESWWQHVGAQTERVSRQNRPLLDFYFSNKGFVDTAKTLP